MATTLPVPVKFRLPNDHWQPVEPESLGVHNAAFLAVRREHGSDYAPTITISGDVRTDEATLDDIAEEAVGVVQQEVGPEGEVTVLSRRDLGSDDAPAVIQVLGVRARLGEETLVLCQGQVLMEMKDVDDPARRAVVKIVMTTARDQFETFLPELQDFMRTFRPEEAPAQA